MKFKTNLLFICFLFSSLSLIAQLTQDTRQNLPIAEEYRKMTKHQTTLKGIFVYDSLPNIYDSVNPIFKNQPILSYCI